MILLIPLMILISASVKAQNNFIAALNSDELEKVVNISSTTEINNGISPDYDPAMFQQVYKRQLVARTIRNSISLKKSRAFFEHFQLDLILPKIKQFNPPKKWSAGFTVQDYINIQWKEKQFSFDSFLSAECEPVSRIDLTPEHLLKCSISFKF